MLIFLCFNAVRNWADTLADLRRRWAHMPFCWLCHESAQLFSVLGKKNKYGDDWEDWPYNVAVCVLCDNPNETPYQLHWREDVIFVKNVKKQEFTTSP